MEGPVGSTADAEQDATWMAEQWMSIAIVSIVAGRLLGIGLPQATGLTDVLGPIADTSLDRFAAFAVLVVVVLGAFLWLRRET